MARDGMNEAWLTDEALAQAVAQQDSAAFRLLTHRHYARGLSLALRVLGERSAAEDALQAAFLKLWSHADRYDAAKGSFRSWFSRVVVNCCLDGRRRLKLVEPMEAAAEVADSAPLPDAQLERRQQGEAVQAAMAGLPERQRAALALFYGEGLSMAEVANILETNAKAVESLLSRGRSALKARLGGVEHGV
jgi:RNA polymerase sigma-70 factor, ECF subfamily